MKIMVTKAGLQKLENDLLTLKSKDMREALQYLTDARDKGDVSENSEYDVARDNINILNIKISSLEERIRNSVVIHKENIDTSSVQLFTTVKLQNLKTKKSNEFTIVTDDEANVKVGKISYNSPIAKGLLGHKKGEKVKIDIPVGTIEFKIMSID